MGDTARPADPPPAAPGPDVLSALERTALEGGDETALCLAVARRYYFGNQSKVTIAKTMNLSRFQVARLLAEARSRGLVRIEIGSPGQVDHELSAALGQALGISRAVVVTTQSGSPRSARDFVGAQMARIVAEDVLEGAVLGLTWSRATAVMAADLTRLRPCTVIQLAGALYPPGDLPGSVEIVRTVADANGGTAHPVYAPLLVPDADTARGLLRQPEIAAAMARYDRLDVAVISVGAWRSSASAVYDLLEGRERAELDDAGACGEISGRVFDSDGNPVHSRLDDRVIGITLDQLRHVPHVITSSYGAYRSDATRAAARAGLADTLVADEELARALLE